MTENLTVESHLEDLSIGDNIEMDVERNVKVYIHLGYLSIDWMGGNIQMHLEETGCLLYTGSTQGPVTCACENVKQRGLP
jgi:hypothetical protein